MELLILLAAWLVMIIWGIKFNKSSNPEPLSRSNADALRGIAAIEIILGHMPMYFSAPVLEPVHKVNIMFVSIFLMLSGYGIAYSITNKDNYLKTFLPKKLVKLVIPVFLVYACGVAVIAQRYCGIEYLKNIYNVKEFLISVNWFIYELLAFYILTFIVVSIFKDIKKSTITIFALAILFMIVGYVTKIDKNYYSAIFCYPLGMTLFTLKDKKARTLSVIGSVILLGICSVGYVLMESRIFIISILLKNMAMVLFNIVIFFILQKFTIGNLVSRYLGKISYEIYLIHIIMIGTCHYYIENNLLCGVLSLVSTVAVAALINFVINNTSSQIAFKARKK